MVDFKSWDELDALEQAQVTFWDYFKEAHGYRPRHVDTSTWTLQDFDAAFQELASRCRSNEEDRRVMEAAAADRLERRILTLLEMGAKDREMAVRWLAEAEDAGDDREYLCYLLGVDYGYFK